MSSLAINERMLIRASAGTGKTYQLTNRYISRLLRGVPPSQILAVTFTRYAAAEILDRILIRLARAASDPQETEKLGEAIGETGLQSDRCREVLGEVVDSLQQLRVSTLDSYFNQVASSFSLELRLPVPWQMIDDIQTADLKREAVRRVVDQGSQTVLRRLVNLLADSDAARSVEDTLVGVVTNLHRIYLETAGETGDRAWKWLKPPPRPGRTEIGDVVEAMENAPLPEDNSWHKAHQKAIADVDAMEWAALVGRGLGVKIVTAGEDRFDDPKVPVEVVSVYKQALKLLRADVANTLVDQTAAIHDVLEMFDAEFTKLKNESGYVEFGDITRELATAALGNDSQRLAHRLNSGIDHLMLDEFQDTSPLQWQVIEPLARAITDGNDADRSFFCVGDRKQAIYGWRGGVAEILEELETELSGLDGDDLSESFRSTPEVIRTINQVFGNLDRHDNLDQVTDAVTDWPFDDHEAHHSDRKGYACLKTLPGERGNIDDEATFDEIAEIINGSGGHSVGILVRQNKTVGHIVSQLRQRGVRASQEGGFPLTDSAPVLALLSMMRLADHPADSLAAFHVASSPIGELVGLDRSSDQAQCAAVSRRVREDLADRGYGAVIGDLARKLAAASDCDERFRLSQIVRLASRFDAQSTLRPAAFDRFVQSEGFGDPSTDRVRVMTIHKAKGLEFDIVILPELNSSVSGRTNTLSVRRHKPTEPPDRILKTANKSLRLAFRGDPDINGVYVAEQSRNATEAMCVMYVAMTRARHALHMLIPPSTKTKEKDLPATMAGLLRASLTDGDEVEAGVVLFEDGDPEWWSLVEQPVEPVAEDISLDITLEPCGGSRRRGRSRRAPSGLEGPSEVDVAAIFEAGSGANMQHGTLVHAWLEHTEWSDHVPDDQALEQIAHRNHIHVDDLDVRIANLRTDLQQPEIQAMLTESSYQQQQWLPFNDDVNRQILEGDGPQLEVRCEYPFTIDQDGEILNGTIDRLVLLRHGDVVIAADTIDYKTDHVENQDDIDKKVEYYRGQLEAYRDAVGRVFGLDDDHIATRLAFVGAGQLATV